jgi:hypothetical protein
MDQRFESGHRTGFHADNRNELFRNATHQLRFSKQTEIAFTEEDKHERNTIKKKEKNGTSFRRFRNRFRFRKLGGDLGGDPVSETRR